MAQQFKTTNESSFWKKNDIKKEELIKHAEKQLFIARSGPNSKAHRFHHNCEEMFLWKRRKLLSKNIFINNGFLILHDVRKLDFFKDAFFWYNNVNGVQPER